MITTAISAIILGSVIRPAAPNFAALGDLDHGSEIKVMRVIEGKLYVGGRFERANRKLANNIAVWDGKEWSTLGKGVDGVVKDIRAHNGSIFVCGDFSYANKGKSDEGTPANRIAKWNGTTWSGLAANTVDRDINALASDGKSLYIGGNFTKINNETETRSVARWNGTKFESIGGKFDRAVMSMVFCGSKLYCGGIFKEFEDDEMKNIAVWDYKTWSEAGSGGLSGSVYRLSTDGTSVYAAGNYAIGGKSGVAKFDGSKWSLALETDGNPAWVHVEKNGDIYAAGQFTKANGMATHNVAALIGGKDLMVLNEVLYAIHWSLIPFGGSMIIGGSYGDVKADQVGGVLKWSGDKSIDKLDVVSGG